MTGMTTMSGGCHCGAVRFEVDAPADFEPVACTCSICAMTGYLHLIVPAASFRLLRGEDSLTTYAFNTGIARHMFCKHCGVKSFYVPRSHPDGISVNVRCLDGEHDTRKVRTFDGRHWEQNVAGLRASPDAGEG